MRVVDYPLLLLLPVSFLVMAGASWLGAWFATRRSQVEEGARADFDLILASTLTLLGLIIGFTFSMAVSRYDQRKNFEEEEANAIGTAYLRMDFLPAADAAKARALLREYTAQRIAFYVTRDSQKLDEIGARTAKLQNDVWAAVRDPALVHRDPMTQLAVASMNDVINSQGYTQAAWWNRIPRAAWLLMAAIALCANFMVGYGAKNPKGELRLLLVLPVVVAIAFFLIGDIDAPHAGVIRIAPQNLEALVPSLR
jgi:lipopolysaccharide export LptBFGC system permease protein LptF